MMDWLDDFIFGPLNVIDRLDGWIRGAMYGDFGYKIIIPRYDKGGKHTLNECNALLNHYGVAVYGRTHDSQNMYFKVKKRQARWAEYVLTQAGVEMKNPPYDSRNAGYFKGKLPRAWNGFFEW